MKIQTNPKARILDDIVFIKKDRKEELVKIFDEYKLLFPNIEAALGAMLSNGIADSMKEAVFLSFLAGSISGTLLSLDKLKKLKTF